MKILSLIGTYLIIVGVLAAIITTLAICVSAIAYMLAPVEGYILQGLVWTAGITLPSAVAVCIGVISYGMIYKKG